jgi:hypothetical protein
MPHKCTSQCKQFPKEDCNAPRCRYIDGSQRQYCRLSYKYKMLKPSCKVTRKYKKGEVRQAAEKKIQRFIGRSEKVIKTLCSNSGQCIAFGRKIAEINHFFKGFTGFHYVTGPVKPLGQPSKNGFVKEIAFERNGYKSYAILKSSKRPNADNLVYEYLVGIKYINRILRQYPCFIETYGLFYYKDPAYWTRMQTTFPIYNTILQQLELQNTIDYSKSCIEPHQATILVQHISGAKTLFEFLSKLTHINTVKYDIVFILFIIYHALSSISKTFTHYDLHDGNIMIYEPSPGKYIQYEYHMANNKTISFKCPYLPKIIDYGRSFFDNGNINSKKIYERICREPDCDDCGDLMGYSWLTPDSHVFIRSSEKNESHDLRLLYIVKNAFDIINSSVHPTTLAFKRLFSVLKKVKFGIGIKDPDEKNFGTKENLSMDTPSIYNVTSAYMQLRELCETPALLVENETRYSNPANKLGILHIYDDGRSMVYEA